MGTNVYGSPVTEMSLEDLPAGYRGRRGGTRFALANAAWEMINKEQKLDRARAYLDKLENKYGKLNAACVKGLIYNATGEIMTFVRDHDWSGHVGESAYPTEIYNGQWGVFFHHKPPVEPSSCLGAVVYRLKDVPPNPDVDCMMSWCAGWGPWDSNHCYAQIFPRGFYSRNDIWQGLKNMTLDVRNRRYVEKSKSGNLQAELTIGGDSVAEWKAVVRLLQ